MSKHAKWIKKMGRGDGPLGSMPDEAALSILDIDCVVHQYIQRNSLGEDTMGLNLMFLELKNTGESSAKLNQIDSVNVIDQCFKASGAMFVDTVRGRRLVNYHGYHWVTIPKGTIEESGVIFDGNRISAEDYAMILSFQKLPPKPTDQFVKRLKYRLRQIEPQRSPRVALKKEMPLPTF